MCPTPPPVFKVLIPEGRTSYPIFRLVVYLTQWLLIISPGLTFKCPTFFPNNLLLCIIYVLISQNKQQLISHLKLTNFYNLKGVCLLCSTSWISKQNLGQFGFQEFNDVRSIWRVLERDYSPAFELKSSFFWDISRGNGGLNLTFLYYRSLNVSFKPLKRRNVSFLEYLVYSPRKGGFHTRILVLQKNLDIPAVYLTING